MNLQRSLYLDPSASSPLWLLSQQNSQAAAKSSFASSAADVEVRGRDFSAFYEAAQQEARNWIRCKSLFMALIQQEEPEPPAFRCFDMIHLKSFCC